MTFSKFQSKQAYRERNKVKKRKLQDWQQENHILIQTELRKKKGISWIMYGFFLENMHKIYYTEMEPSAMRQSVHASIGFTEFTHS